MFSLFILGIQTRGKHTQTHAHCSDRKVWFLTFAAMPAKAGSAEILLDSINDLCITLQQLYLASIPEMLQFVLK